MNIILYDKSKLWALDWKDEKLWALDWKIVTGVKWCGCDVVGANWARPAIIRGAGGLQLFKVTGF